MSQTTLLKSIAKALITMTVMLASSGSHADELKVKPISAALASETNYLQSSLEAEFYYQNGLYSEAFTRFLTLFRTYPDEALAEKVFMTGFFAGEYKALSDVLDELNFSDDMTADYQYPLIALHTFTGDLKQAENMLSTEIGDTPENIDLVMRKLFPVLETEWHNPKVLTFLKRVVEKTDHARMRELYANVAMLHGKVDVINALSDDILAERPNNATWLNSYAQFLLVYVDEDAAKKVWETALTDFPNSTEIRIDAARFYLQTRNFERALSIVEKLPDDDTRLGIKRMIQASALLKKGDKDGFDALLDNAKETGGIERIEDKLFLAEVLREATHYYQAIKLLENVAKDTPDYKRIAAKLALLKTQLYLYDDADTYIDDVVKLSADESLHPKVLKASYREEAKQYYSALSLLDEYLKDFPEDRSVLYQRTLLLDQVGRYRESIDSLRKLYLDNPLDDNSQNALGYMLLAYTDDVDEGMNLVKKAFRVTPRSGPVTDSVGWGLYRQGDLAGAEFFLRAAYFRMDEAEILAHLIVVLFERGKEDEAKLRLEQNLTRLSENPRIEHIWRPIAEKHHAISPKKQ